jgi:hypothetical protein
VPADRHADKRRLCVDVALAVRADDDVQPYRLQPEMPLAAPAERAHDLIERQEAIAVIRLVALAVGQRGQDLVVPRAPIIGGPTYMPTTPT